MKELRLISEKMTKIIATKISSVLHITCELKKIKINNNNNNC